MKIGIDDSDRRVGQTGCRGRALRERDADALPFGDPLLRCGVLHVNYRVAPDRPGQEGHDPSRLSMGERNHVAWPDGDSRRQRQQKE